MYLGVDIGGTKTLVAVLDDQGVIIEQARFPTPATYEEFLKELRNAAGLLKNKEFKAGGVGIPAVQLNRAAGIGISFGNLSWQNVPIKQDMEETFKCQFVMENDAKMAALSEAMLHKEYGRVLYITVSTGIGIGFVANGVIDTNIGDGGGRTILLEHDGKTMPWEDFASGRAIVTRYGKKAMDIHDDMTWQAISHDLAEGMIELIAVIQPQVIVIGGSVGNYLDRFLKFLVADVQHYNIPIVTLPKIIEAQRPDEAVIFGCYDLAKQVFGNADAAA